MLTLSREDAKFLIKIHGELILGNQDEFENQVLEELENGCRKFEIDLSETTYIDASGLNVMVRVEKEVRKTGGSIIWKNPQENIRTLLDLTRLDAILLVVNDQDRVGSKHTV